MEATSAHNYTYSSGHNDAPIFSFLSYSCDWRNCNPLRAMTEFQNIPDKEGD